MSAVPEIWRQYGASISGAHRRIKSANFADLVSGLKRLRSAPRAASRLIAADVQASGLPQAAARGTLNALAVEAFNDLLKKHGKRQNVENPLLD
jgi:predicted outer membrane lipoprotein